MRLTVRVTDALDFFAADRARPAKFAVHGHLPTERRHVLWKTTASFSPQNFNPMSQGSLCGVKQSPDGLGRKLLRQRHGREPGAVQDFVRIRIANAAEQVRIGQGALERVISQRERRAEFLQRAVEDIQTSRFVNPQGRFALNEVERRPFLCSRFRDRECAARKFECGQSALSGRLCAGLAPVQATRDH